MNQIYLFYSPEKNPTEQLMKKNPFFQCFIKNIVDADNLFTFLKQKNFN